MNIRNTIQRYIDEYGGSETRIIKNTMADHQCKESEISSSIDWLVKKGFIILVSKNDMTQFERNYYESDSCKIYRNLKRFDEMKFYEEERKRKEFEEKLPNKEKFKLYISRLEKEFDRKHFCNSKDYKISYLNNSAKIEMESDKNIINIDFENIKNFIPDDNDESFIYNNENGYFTIELSYRWSKCYLLHYKSY